MTEPVLPAFPPPSGLMMVGADDAAACVDGVCAVPSLAGGDFAGEPPEDPGPTR